MQVKIDYSDAEIRRILINYAQGLMPGVKLDVNKLNLTSVDTPDKKGMVGAVIIVDV